MSHEHPAALALSRKVLRGLIVLNGIAGALILLLLVASLMAPEMVFSALGVRPVPASEVMRLGMRLVMVIGIASVPLTYIVLTRLLAIVDTVREGDPFVAVNAARLQTIAWSVLGLELLHLVVGIIAASVSTDEQPLDLDWSFSVTRWLAVLLLFVLARVFEHGARMRADLEGTV